MALSTVGSGIGGTSAASVIASRRTRRVLLVDDEPGVRLIMGSIIQSAGHELDTARDGFEALEKVRSFKPDVIVMDMRMPDLDGHELCKKLQLDSRTALIPVIFATASEEIQDRARAFAAGAVDYLVKPIERETLLHSLEVHFETAVRWQDLQPDPPSRTDVRSPNFGRFRKLFLDEFGDGLDNADGTVCSTFDELCKSALHIGLTSEYLAKRIASFFNVSYLPSVNPTDLKLGVLPAPFCKSQSVATLNAEKSGARVVVSNPFNLQLADALKSEGLLESPSDLAIATSETIRALFEEERPPSDRMPLTSVDSAAERESVNDLVASTKRRHVVNVANSVVLKAVEAGASDIHLQPLGHTLGIRHRIDGVLYDQEPLPLKLQSAVLSRFKIMANLDIAERRVPQDGRIQILFEDRPIDLRVSVLPAKHGEKIVLRILDKSNFEIDVDSLGFDRTSLKKLHQSIQRSHGIILATGPTGSGKTTTLYAALQQLNRPSVNVVTVEDPIEYEVPRATQVQVHSKSGRTFSAVLRSILRQDPDVIMVGELRDNETIDSAFKAALTGHLVLSTLHTNDAPSTITRLVNMGVEPYLVASSLELVVAQRLLRRLCPHCKVQTEIPTDVSHQIDSLGIEHPKFYSPGRCDQCSRTGYRGRLLVAEVMSVDPGLRGLVARGADTDTVRAYAQQNGGMVLLRHDALRKAALGYTSLEEVLRVTR